MVGFEKGNGKRRKTLLHFDRLVSDGNLHAVAEKIKLKRGETPSACSSLTEPAIQGPGWITK